jgi:iron(III) transport system permease protein
MSAIAPVQNKKALKQNVLRTWINKRSASAKATFVMAAIILTLGLILIWPVVLLLAMSFNTAADVLIGPWQWGLGNWRVAWTEDRIFPAIGNTFLLWGLQFGISLPISVLIAWTLARTRIPFSRTLEFMFWIAYIMPGGVIAWMLLLDPDIGYINILGRKLPFVDGPIFDIFSVAGMVWVSVMGNGIALKVMLLTPAFRNMDAALEQAATVSGASNIKTMLRVTLPLMAPPIALVTALQIMRIFQSFETELLLGTPIGFYVYSTLIYDVVRLSEPPLYGQATVLASLTLVILAFIIPLQRWILQRRRYTTISSGFKPGLIDLGRGRWIVFGMLAILHMLLTFVPAIALFVGSFMWKSGYFMIDDPWTLQWWKFVFSSRDFITALGTTLTLSFTTGIVSPILFSLIAYILVRTRWPGRLLLDSIIWVSAALPGMLSGLGLLLLFLGTPGLSILYGTLWALIIVVVLQGNTTGVNISKTTIVQVGFDMEEASRISGAGWFKTYFKIWLPLMMPTLVLLGVMNFVIAANTTSSIILLASRETITLSILVLEYAMPGSGMREAASVVNIIVMVITLIAALTARHYGFKLGVRHQ